MNTTLSGKISAKTRQDENRSLSMKKCLILTSIDNSEHDRRVATVTKQGRSKSDKWKRMKVSRKSSDLIARVFRERCATWCCV